MERCLNMFEKRFRILKIKEKTLAFKKNVPFLETKTFIKQKSYIYFKIKRLLINKMTKQKTSKNR